LLRPLVELVRIYRSEEDLNQFRQTDPFPRRDLAACRCRHDCRHRGRQVADAADRRQRERYRRGATASGDPGTAATPWVAAEGEGEFDGLVGQAFGLAFEY
jgi:hypothetical protein